MFSQVKSKFLVLFSILISCLFFFFFKKNEPKSTVKEKTQVLISGLTMGTYYKVSFFPHEKNRAEEKKLKKLIENDLLEINRQMSTYISDSEISQVNLADEKAIVDISPWFLEVLDYSLELAEQTSGYFDPTVGPLVNLWGFGPQKSSKKPSEYEIKKTLKFVGYKKLSLKKNKLKKSSKKLYLDLSSVAKGFAVDQLSKRLKSLDYNNHLVEIGGELKAYGKKSPKRPWIIGIEKPNASNTVHELIVLSDLAIATSGDYRNYYDTAEGTFTHTVSPLSGEARASNLLSVSVLARECMHADALATALMVMGEKKALSFIKTHKLAAYMIVKRKNGFKTLISDSFKKSLRRNSKNV